MDEQRPEPLSAADLALLRALAESLGWVEWDWRAGDYAGPADTPYWADYDDPFLSLYRPGSEEPESYWNPLASMDDAMDLLAEHGLELRREAPGEPCRVCVWTRTHPLRAGWGSDLDPRRAICIALLRAAGR